ncbi:inositol-3-phosphate synthase [Ignicoccus hospitalis]|uniref:Myo-inositol-1-phosphate synthase, GAPDH domain protein n=1 Tax=Ignicoccus hospitalis (strain KIN4/I / DSM 18386 / JCM 14125) TaxID=453591 RepID=A8AAV1_IGNH4|nr:myo-inositol-1-phosphate synthase [Ignicoccus hospitalis]ABU82053.1 Myo-inositol-1-phosphate synthase, GAPDH domain protein [Ignicoccus hospitalis KIN4/I]HIH91010.1 myo-inositol-1-phosphate synthase [Desulfurococcaceae archaeon]
MIRVAVVGAGLVASHYAAGLQRLKRAEIEPYGVPLAKFKVIKDYVEEEVVSAYDVDANKVGKPLSEVVKRQLEGVVPVPPDVPDFEVREGVLASSGAGLDKMFPVRGRDQKLPLKEAVEEIAKEFKSDNVNVVLNLISTEPAEPFGDEGKLAKALERGEVSAGQAYAFAAYLAAKDSGKPVAFINLIPTPLANDPAFVKLYEDANSLVLGDDGATGATPLTADLLEHLAERNRKVRYIVQFNIGGNTDFLALTIPERNLMKEKTKSSVVEDILGYDAPHYIKPTGYVEAIGDRKFVAMDIEWITFNGLVDELIVNMRINDSPALAGLAVDLVRLAAALLEKGVKGTFYDVNAFFMKNPGPKEARNKARIKAYYDMISALRELGVIVE